MVASLDPNQQPGPAHRKWGGGGLHLVQATGATIPSESPCRPPPQEITARRAPRDSAEVRVAPLRAAPVPAPVRPTEDTAAEPRGPLDVTDDDASCVLESWTLAGNASTF